MRCICTQINRYRRGVLALVCAAVLGSGDAWASAAIARQAATAQQATIPADQLDSLVAPIALYPDPLLAQMLAASTYPLEIMQLQQWLAQNPGLKDKALADAVARQPWDPSVQAMAALPDVVKQLAANIQWTTDLGNAFLAQESDVMRAVQRMRARAQNNGNLKSTPQQTVETQVVQNQPVIVIEQASPDVVYVPSYNPMVVWGEPVYPYPAISYPHAGYWTGAAIGFGAGMALGAFWGSGGWGWRPGWGDWDVNINRNNNFIRNNNFARNTNIAGNRWQHNPMHRGGAPYRDRATANRFGGTARGESLANRQAAARQQLSRQGGNLSSARSGNLGNRGVGTGGVGNRQAAGSLGTRGGGRNVGDRAVGTSGQLGSRGGGGQLSSRDFSRDLSRTRGGADRVGQRNLSRSGGSSYAWGGGGAQNLSRARASSQRGAASFQSRSGSSFNNRSFKSGGRSFGGGGRSFGGGGRSFGGGGRGGGGRGGGRR